MLIIVTGKTGVGKTTILKNSKYKNILFLDEVVKNELYKRGTSVYNKIIKTFNDVETNKKIDTQKLGKIVFNNSQKLKLLNSIMIPTIKKYLQKLNGDYIVEMATFINYYDEFKSLADKVIMIKTTQEKLKHKFSYLKNKVNPIPSKMIKYNGVIINDWDIPKAVKKFNSIIKSYNLS